MRYKYAIGCFLFLIIGLAANAQKTESSADTTKLRKVWIRNQTTGQIVADSGAKVLRVFFEPDKKIMVQSNSRWQKGDKFGVLLPGIAHWWEDSPYMPLRVKNAILKSPLGTKVTIIIYHKESTATLEIYIDELKEKTLR
jgi:hypothetical protein